MSRQLEGTVPKAGAKDNGEVAKLRADNQRLSEQLHAANSRAGPLAEDTPVPSEKPPLQCAAIDAKADLEELLAFAAEGKHRMFGGPQALQTLIDNKTRESKDASAAWQNSKTPKDRPLAQSPY